jgi:small subunit ribosomal protein S5
MAMNVDRFNSADNAEGFERVVNVNRVSKKTKGGDKRGLSVLVVVGDRNGSVGVGLGKAADVQSAVAKATSYARRHQVKIELVDNRTIAHQVLIKKGAASVLLKPAAIGTGVIAGGPVRVVAEAAGIKDLVAKILGTNNKSSNVYATLKGLMSLKSKEDYMEARRSAKSEKKVKEPKNG